MKSESKKKSNDLKKKTSVKSKDVSKKKKADKNLEKKVLNKSEDLSLKTSETEISKVKDVSKISLFDRFFRRNKTTNEEKKNFDNSNNPLNLSNKGEVKDLENLKINENDLKISNSLPLEDDKNSHDEKIDIVSENVENGSDLGKDAEIVVVEDEVEVVDTISNDENTDKIEKSVVDKADVKDSFAIVEVKLGEVEDNASVEKEDFVADDSELKTTSDVEIADKKIDDVKLEDEEEPLSFTIDESLKDDDSSDKKNEENSEENNESEEKDIVSEKIDESEEKGNDSEKEEVISEKTDESEKEDNKEKEKLKEIEIVDEVSNPDEDESLDNKDLDLEDEKEELLTDVKDEITQISEDIDDKANFIEEVDQSDIERIEVLPENETRKKSQKKLFSNFASRLKTSFSKENIFSEDEEDKEPKEKTSKKKWVWILLIFGIIISLIIGCILLLGYHFDNNYDYEIKPSSEIRNFKLGDRILYNGVIYSVSSAKVVDGTEYRKAKNGYEFILVNISLENNSDEKVKYGYKNWRMSNSKDKETGRIFTPVNATTALYNGTLFVGSTKKGSLVFEQPKDDEALVLNFYDFIENKTTDEEGNEVTKEVKSFVFSIDIKL